MSVVEIIPLAATKAAQRGITAEQIIETVEHPEQTVPGYGGRTVYQRRVRLQKNREQLLRVICEVVQGKQVVITAYLTSDITRYWR